MLRIKTFFFGTLFFAFFTGFISCKDGDGHISDTQDFVSQSEKMDDHVSRDIAQVIQYALRHGSQLSDSVKLHYDSLLSIYYHSRGFAPVWSADAKRLPAADSLYTFIMRSREYGLFPADYHVRYLRTLWEKTRPDTTRQEDAMIWSQLDVLLTDAVYGLASDLRIGRLPRDSVSLRKDSVLNRDFFEHLMQSISSDSNVGQLFHQLEPQIPQYDSLKWALRHFIDSVKYFPSSTYIQFPAADSLELRRQVQLRLYELNKIVSDTAALSEREWARVLRVYQKSHGLKETGKVNKETVNSLNRSPLASFNTFALNLDRYKQLPDTMPEKYIWVNIPSFYLDVRVADTTVFRSRIVVGKPETRTPLLTSKITDMVSYPQWNIPNSIIVKEVLPGIQKDPDYLSEKGYTLLNAKGEEVDPHTVKWKLYKKSIPFKLIQGSGDDNALGILKFNFSNKYSVYMHDTNQRYLFGNTSRSLSHGCVRVQEWKKLAEFLLSNDSASTTVTYTGNYPAADSLKAWIKRKEKRYLPLKNRMPVFIRYVTAEVVRGKLRFYEDIYEEDKYLKERYFAGKTLD